MKEFIEKLIGRLEALRNDKYVNGVDRFTTREKRVFDIAEEIVNQLAEEYKEINIPTIDAGELLGNGWIPCSSGVLPQMGNTDNKLIWVTMHQKGVDFYFTRKVNWNHYYKRWEWDNGKKIADEWEVVAWLYINIPEPYQPKESSHEEKNT